jgi:hypothetical protein
MNLAMCDVSVGPSSELELQETKERLRVALFDDVLFEVDSRVQ